jgi:hypothetical protein
MAERLLVGTEDELTARFAEEHERGIDRFYVWFSDFGPVDTIRRFGDVIEASAAADGRAEVQARGPASATRRSSGR